MTTRPVRAEKLPGMSRVVDIGISSSMLECPGRQIE